MHDQIKQAFDCIRMDEALRAKTLHHIRANAQQARKKPHWAALKGAIALSCLCMLIFAGILSHTLYYAETLYLDVDINPALSLGVNRFDRVIAATPYNADGKALLENLSLTHMPTKEAIAAITQAAIHGGYVLDGGLVSVTVQGEDMVAEGKLLKALEESITLVAKGCHMLVMVDAFAVDEATRADAAALSMTPAKYLAIQALQVVDPTATMEGCRGHSIPEIRAQTDAHRGGHHGGAPAPAEGGAQGPMNPGGGHHGGNGMGGRKHGR